MANFSKSFNFRNGVQVDNDNLVVNAVGRVGIGTSIPIADLDVRGEVYATGIISTPLSYVTDSVVLGFATIRSASIGILSVTSSGIVTATSDFPSGIITYFGDGGRLLNLPTSQWLDVDVGLGFTSIFSQGYVGIATRDPRYVFQIGGDTTPTFATASGVGIDSYGQVYATGIITASIFRGAGGDLFNINADNITTGTLSTDRLPIIPNTKLPDSLSFSGIITALGHFRGNLVGIASTAINLTSDSTVSIRQITSSFANLGVTTITSELDVESSVGIQTRSPQADLHVVKSGIASIQLTGATESTILLGRGLNSFNNSAGLKYGNVDVAYPYSTTGSLDIINYQKENINSYLDYGSASGVGTGSFQWIYAQNASSPLMSLTYQGNLGIGITNPSNRLEVAGTVKFNSTSTFEASVTINNGNLVINNGVLNADINGDITGTLTGNVYANTGVSTFSTVQVETANVTTVNAVSIGINTDVVNNFNSVDLNLIAANALFQQVSVGATEMVCAVDLSDAGKEVSVAIGAGSSFEPGRYMLVPKITSTQRNRLTSSLPASGVPTGALIYNTTLERFQTKQPTVFGGGSRQWVDFVLGSGGNINLVAGTNSTGILTATNVVVAGTQIGSGIVTTTELRVGTGITASSGVITATAANVTTELKIGAGVTIGSGIVTAVNGFFDSIGNVRDYPQNSRSLSAADYTLQASDLGKHVYITNTTNNVIVPANVFSIGDVVLIVNATTNNLTVDNAGGASPATVRLAGSTATSPHVMPAYGIGFLLCVASNTFILHGVGIA